MVSPPILLIPGLGNSGPEHWQSYWERSLANARRVTQSDWDEPQLAQWVATLDAAIHTSVQPPLLVAHSLGCALVAHWSAQHARLIHGALLVSPSDVDSPAHTPDVVRSFSPLPLRALPFASIVIASTNDPYITIQRAEAFAQAWNSRFVSVGALGHINAASRLGAWPEGQVLLHSLQDTAAA